MGDCPESRKLFQSVANRLRLGSIGQSAFVGSCVAGILYAIAFVASRLLGLTADWFHPVTVLLIPTVGLLAAMMFHRRPTHIDTARRIDTHEKTKDLFLTVTLLDSTAGEYQSRGSTGAQGTAGTHCPLGLAGSCGLDGRNGCCTAGRRAVCPATRSVWSSRSRCHDRAGARRSGEYEKVDRSPEGRT